MEIAINWLYRNLGIGDGNQLCPKVAEIEDKEGNNSCANVFILTATSLQLVFLALVGNHDFLK